MEEGEPKAEAMVTTQEIPAEETWKSEGLSVSVPAEEATILDPLPRSSTANEDRMFSQSVSSELAMSLKQIWVNSESVKERPKKERVPLGRERSKMSLLLIEPPIDLSFRNVSDLMDLTKLKPRSVRLCAVPPRALSGRYLTSSIWASYNELQSTTGLESCVLAILEHPEALTWLDLSFNQITDISEDIINFPQLRVLLMHSNKIDSYTVVGKLSCLPKLQSVTLKGNPIERNYYYRKYIIKLLPQIKCLDFNQVTIRERKEPLPLDAKLLKKANHPVPVLRVNPT